MKTFKMYYKPEDEETVKKAINNADALKKLVEKRVILVEELEINQESEEQKEQRKKFLKRLNRKPFLEPCEFSGGLEYKVKHCTSEKGHNFKITDKYKPSYNFKGYICENCGVYTEY